MGGANACKYRNSRKGESKKVIWFKHMANMRHDKKLKKVFNRYGLEGYGLYNLILESITDSLTTEDPMPDLEETAGDIAEFYNGDTTHIEEMRRFMMGEKLFEVDEISGSVLCHKIYKFLQSGQTRSDKIKGLIASYAEAKKLPAPAPDPGQDDTPAAGIVSDSLRQSQTVSDCHSENRTEQNTKEEEKEEAAGFSSIPENDKRRIRTRSDIDTLISYWNSREELPEFRKLTINISNGSQIIDNCSHYEDEEIRGAIDNYADMLADAGSYAFIPRFPTVASFLEKGVQMFFQGANPRQTFKDPKKSPAGGNGSIQAVFYYLCECGCKFETGIGNCPECYKNKRDPRAPVTIKGDEYPADMVRADG